MKKNDKDLIEEKLNAFAAQADGDGELDPPEELTVRAHALAQVSADAVKAEKRKSNKKRFWLGFAPTAVAAVVVVLCCSLLIPKKTSPDPSEPEFYYDIDLTAYNITYSELTDKFEILLPDLEYIASSYSTHNYNKNNKPIYTSMLLHTIDGQLSINIVFVNNYTIDKINSYENLSDSETTDLLTYEYRIIDEAGKAFAKFEYDGYRYYVDYTSEYPEDITQIMTTLTMR